jgi:hypothetical protein
MSLYENKINEQVDKLLPTNDYINALTKAILKDDNEEKEYLIQKIKEANKKESEMIYRDFHFDINGNYLFDVAGNLQKAGNSSFPCDPILNETDSSNLDSSGNIITDNSKDAEKE